MIRLCLMLSLLWPITAMADQFERVAQITLPKDAVIGGLSGLSVTADGNSFVAVTDRGHFVEGTLMRGPNGALMGVADLRATQMQHLHGGPLRKYFTDSEGLARAKDGGLLVSFETENRVWYYPNPKARPRPWPASQAIRALPLNEGLEGIALLPGGDLLALPEKPVNGEFPIFRLRNGVWREWTSITARNGYMITGADMGPDGHLYVLERHFTLFGGMKPRIRRFAVRPDGLRDETVVYEPNVVRLANFEGIALWRSQTGTLRALIISDDNFMGLMVSQLEELELRTE